MDRYIEEGGAYIRKRCKEVVHDGEMHTHGGV